MTTIELLNKARHCYTYQEIRDLVIDLYRTKENAFITKEDCYLTLVSLLIHEVQKH